MAPRKKLELTPEEQQAEARDAALMAAARALSDPPTRPLHELFPGATPIPELIYWAGVGRLFKVKIALNNGADLDEIGPFGTTALQGAAARGHLEVVRLLVEQGADVGLRSRGGQTALELAREAGRADVVAYLESVTDPS
jgi:ankyrin repeat protein